MLGAHHFWLHDILPSQPPAEQRSNCSACAMLPPATDPPARTYFTPEVRCCTFEPALPNFIAGRILRDPDPALDLGRRTLRQRMQRLADVKPWGVRRSMRFEALYQNPFSVFGQAVDLACPHLQPGDLGCGIWTHRPSVCATWHCKHDRGKIGSAFWNNLDQLLREVETTVAAWCLMETGASEAALSEALWPRPVPPRAEDLGGAPDQSAYQDLWGAHAGREEEFYLRCAALADQLSWQQIQDLGGLRLRELLRRTRHALDRVQSNTTPQRPRLDDLRVQPGSSGQLLIHTYSGYNMLQVPARLIAILPRFNGRPTAEVLAEIQTEMHLRIDPGLVRKLVDFGVLNDLDQA